MKIGIVGASGFLGKHMFQLLKNRGHDLIGTFCHNPLPGVQHLDLKNPVPEIFKDRECVVLLSALTKPDFCFSHKNQSDIINIYGPKQIAEWCFNRNIHVVFASTNYVFSDGDLPRTEEEMPLPDTVYGKQKLIMENFLLQKNPEKSLILRYGRVWGYMPGEGIVTDTIAELRSGKKIYAAFNQIFTPIHIEDACLMTAILIEMKQNGIFHVGGSEHFSRLDLSMEIARTIGAPLDLIQKIDYSGINFPEKRPMNTTINCLKIQKTTGHFCISMQTRLQELQDCKSKGSFNSGHSRKELV